MHSVVPGMYCPGGARSFFREPVCVGEMRGVARNPPVSQGDANLEKFGNHSSKRINTPLNIFRLINILQLFANTTNLKTVFPHPPPSPPRSPEEKCTINVSLLHFL